MGVTALGAMSAKAEEDFNADEDEVSELGLTCDGKLLEAFENRHAMMCLLFLKDHSCCYRMNCSKERMEVTS